MLKDILPAPLRKKLYIGFALCVLACGAVSVYCATLGLAVPAVVVGAKAVLVYVGGALGVVAGANTLS